MRFSCPILLALVTSILSSCDEDVLTFPEPSPASVRVVNVTRDVVSLGVLVDGTTSFDVARGEASGYVPSPAGRAVSFVLLDSGRSLRRDTLFYTLGGSARVILFAKGTKTNLVEFRSAVQDTVLPTSETRGFVKFVHMAEYELTDGEFVEVVTPDGTNVFPEVFLPGIASPSWVALEPGTYTFQIRAYGTTDILTTLSNVSISAGSTRILYTFDAAPPVPDSLALSIF